VGCVFSDLRILLLATGGFSWFLIIIIIIIISCYVDPSYHSMARPQVADGGDKSPDVEGSCEYY
jgi:hypothetical protein